MNLCPRCKAKFSTVEEVLKHERNFSHEYKQMDPKEKAIVVARVEGRMVERLIGHDVDKVVAVAKPKPMEIIIERTPEPKKTVVEPKARSSWEVLPDFLEPGWVG